MSGGLLQLIAVGIDSIFLTSNPSITLFKVVYRRHTNFTVVSRTKQIPTIKDFGMDGTYTLQKDADMVHKMWLNFDISDISIEYEKSTYKNIKNLCNKYSINYITNKKDDDIITYDDYINDIIPKFLDSIENNVNSYNKYIDYIEVDKNFNEQVLPNNVKKYTSSLKWCLDKLHDSYRLDSFDIYDNIINVDLYMIFFKIDLIKKLFSYQYTNIVIDSTDYNYSVLDDNLYNYPTYTTENIEFIYKYAINRNSNSSGTINIINNWVNIYLDKLFLDVIQITSLRHDLIIDSDQNNLQDLKYRINSFIDILSYLLNNLYVIYNGKNINSLKIDHFINTENQIAQFKDILSFINEQINEIANLKYLRHQYKHIYDYSNIDSKNIYNDVYDLLFDSDKNFLFDSITVDLLSKINTKINLLITKLNYSLEKVNISITKRIDASEYSNHIIEKFDYFTDTYTSSVDLNNKNLFNAVHSYLNDILNTPEFNERIYTIDEINDILYNEYLSELTYDILGFKIYDDDFNLIAYDTSGNGVDLIQSGIIYTREEFFLKINMLYLSFILLYIIEAGIPFNKNMVGVNQDYLGNIYNTSGYYGFTILDYFCKIIESNRNPLIPILNFDRTSYETADYKALDTYLILSKFLTLSNIIYDEDTFNETFVYKLTQTLKQNLFANIHILYNSILDNILTSSRHNITQLTRIDPTTGKDYIYNNTTEVITGETDYYKFSFFKTFTNEISDTTKFTKIYDTNTPALSDNFSNIFKTFQQNKAVYDIYFAKDIVSSITQMNHDISKYFEISFFDGFFSDYKLWNSIPFSSEKMHDIFQYLTFDKDTGDIVNINYYFDAPGINARSANPTDSYYVNPNYNIYDKFISPLSTKTQNNLALLNYIPFLTIRDFSSEFYEFLKYEGENTQGDFKNILDYLYLFDFRDLDEYNISTEYTPTEQDTIKENLTFKYDLYKQVILKCLLRINRKKNKTNSAPDKDFQTQIFEGNIFKLADSDYIQQFADIYLNTNNVALFSLFRPENFIDITTGFENDIEVSEPYYNNNDDIDITFVQRKIKMPLIRGIIERFRLKILKIINDNFDISGNVIGDYSINKLKEFTNKILNNYVKFDDTNNINNDNYSYDTYKSNGYSFNYIDFQSSIESDIGIGALANLKIYKTSQNNYAQAISSLYSYINKQMIREYNILYNSILLSDTYYESSLGQNMLEMYYFIKSKFTDLSGNNLQFYQDDQIQYYYTYKYKNNDYFDPNNNINRIYLYDTNINYTFPLTTHGFDFYSFGDEIILEKNGSNYNVNVNQDVLYYSIYDPYFNNMSILDYEYFITMSFLGYDIRRSKVYNDIQTSSDYVYKVPQYTQYYSNLLRISNKFKENKNNITSSLEDIIDSLNDYNQTTNTYKYYSGAEIEIAERVKIKMLGKYKVLRDIIRTTGNTDIEKKKH